MIPLSLTAIGFVFVRSTVDAYGTIGLGHYLMSTPVTPRQAYPLCVLGGLAAIPVRLLPVSSISQAYLCALLVFGVCMRAKISSFHAAAGAAFLGTSIRLVLGHGLEQTLTLMGKYPKDPDLLQVLILTLPCSVLVAVVGHLGMTRFRPFPYVFRGPLDHVISDGPEGRPLFQYGTISRLFSVMVLVIAFSDKTHRGAATGSWLDDSAALTLPLILFALVLWASSHNRHLHERSPFTILDVLDLVMLPLLIHLVLLHTGGVNSPYRALHIPVVVTNSLRAEGRGLFSAVISLFSIAVLGFQAWGSMGSWTSDSNFTIGLVYVLTCYVTDQFAMSQASLRKRLVEKATTDDLTNLYNHGFVDSYLQRAISSAQDRTYLLMIDLDNFKLLNDSLGHVDGDRLLRDIADSLKRTVRSGDIVARYGGDEFIVIPGQVAGKDQVLALGERLRRSVEKACELFVAERGSLRMSSALTASVGIAYTGDSIADKEALIRAADEALYSAKSQGKNRSVIAG